MNRWKNLLFGIVITVLFFALAEGVSRLFAFPGSYDFIERRAMEQKLARHKAKGEFRIFLFGESTMFGGSLYPHSTIDKWVGLYLADLLSEDVSLRVIVTNFGRLGEGSRFISTAFMDLIPYDPDLAVFYAIHNDFIQVKHRRELLNKISFADRRDDFFSGLTKKSSFINILNRLAIRWKIFRHKIRDAKLKKKDVWYIETDAGDGVIRDEGDLLHPRSPEFDLVVDDFRNNILKIVAAAKRASIPVIFFEGLCKWKDYEPVRSAHGASLTPDGLAVWSETFYGAEDAFILGRHEDALMMYSGCLNMDPDHALTYYLSLIHI